MESEKTKLSGRRDSLTQANKKHVKNHNKNIATQIQINEKESHTTELTEKQLRNMPQA